MKNVIQMINETTFKLSKGVHDMTLRFERGEWAMYTVNPMVRAYNRGWATPKYFPTLEAVEAKYKSWRGISALVG